ncbi:TonB-dependent receptor; Outer membrane receptor for ferrienterochelin and colicins [hydrothermal vent metagenome]|uniref:TonB-dependent receptor Outer membrane receptor for ferrienterochelin and colicins n=1 Tax=hydrothermal vent metagenome TaxID=652676 RepID=A0A3B1A207_9ZZZZ
MSNKIRSQSCSLYILLLLPGWSLAYASNEMSAKNDVVISVTSTREDKPLSEVPASVGIINKQNIKETKPAHPSEIMNQIPGVHVNVTGGEGHMTAIRQPTTTKAVYLYLEDGIPTRSTGFFNHNALYEVNIPQSESIEIIKGPGTSLYGSDAIGGVVNVLTAAPPLEKQTSINIEAGNNAWYRLLADTGDSDDDSGYVASLNLTSSDGWRNNTEYDRISANLRVDNFLDNGASLKTIFSATDVDQKTAGSSRLLRDDYLNNPELNYTPISYRQVQAYRLSTEYEKGGKDNSLSITPYLRHNTMALLPNWSLSYDPAVYETKNNSIGVLLKNRQNLSESNAVLISGVDIDYSPGSYIQHEISTTKVGNVYTDYTVGQVQYDYDVIFSAISPYVHYEQSLSPLTRFTAGARYDFMQYDYDNNLTTVTTGSQRRPADTVVDFSHFSPKLGLTHQINKSTSAFINYRHAFRAPSNTQLFRQGKAENTVGLKPIKVNSFEIGMRGRTQNKLGYTISLYYMSKTDDILTYKNLDNTRETVNAGETSHKGIEVGLDKALTSAVQLNVAASYAVHTYEDWKPNSSTDYSGNEMESAPRTIINTKLSYRPVALPALKVEVEWVHLGSYWMDQANTQKYKGHDLANIRARYAINKKSSVYTRIMNLLDEKYATAASYKPAAFGNPEKFEYAPGMPLSVFVGYTQKF